jgi:hypothetical protein
VVGRLAVVCAVAPSLTVKTNRPSDDVAIWLLIDTEVVQATWSSSTGTTTTYTVTRGVNGTPAAAHAAAAVVYLVSPAANNVPAGAICPAGGKDQRNKPRPSASSTSCDSGAFEAP